MLWIKLFNDGDACLETVPFCKAREGQRESFLRAVADFPFHFFKRGKRGQVWFHTNFKFV